MPERISLQLFTVFSEIGSVPHCGTIFRRPAEQHQELRLFASALIREKPNSSADELTPNENIRTRRPVGISCRKSAPLDIAGGLFLLVPAVGMVLMFVGLVGAVCGAIINFLNRIRTVRSS